MARARKTVDVDFIRNMGNALLSKGTFSVEPSDDFRVGVARMVEEALHQTDNYKGFQYTDGSRGEENRSYRYYH